MVKGKSVLKKYHFCIRRLWKDSILSNTIYLRMLEFQDDETGLGVIGKVLRTSVEEAK
jgi:hypothetical protein